MLILLNCRELPEVARITSYRLVVIGVLFLFFDFFLVSQVYSMIKDNVFGG